MTITEYKADLLLDGTDKIMLNDVKLHHQIL
jgi:hypothetical protein